MAVGTAAGTGAGERQEAPPTFVVLDDVPAPAALIDATGSICAVNSAWLEFGAANGASNPDTSIGKSYRPWLDSPDVDAERAASGVFGVIEGRLDEFSYNYPCHSPTEQRWFRFLVVPAGIGAPPRDVVAVHLPLGPGVATRLQELTHDRRTQDVLDDPVVVCAWCGTWLQTVDGTQTVVAPDFTSVATISHGICTDCLDAIDR